MPAIRGMATPFLPGKLGPVLPPSTSSPSRSCSQDSKWGMILMLIAIPGRTDSHDAGAWQLFNYFRVMMQISARGRFWHWGLLCAIINMIKCAALQTLLFPLSVLLCGACLLKPLFEQNFLLLVSLCRAGYVSENTGIFIYWPNISSGDFLPR